MHKYYTFLVLALFVLLSCCRDKDPAPIRREHTLLVYMLAENNISANLADDFGEIVTGMKHAPSNFGVYVYIDDLDVPRLYEITPSGAKVVKVFNELNSATTIQLRAVLDLVKTKSPSDSYGLIMSSHGYDWIPASPWNKSGVNPAAIHIAPKFFGDDGNKYMDISDIQSALLPNELIYLGFDACYMSSVEIAYRLKDKMHYMIASPMEILADGFPYHLMLPVLYAQNVNINTEFVLSNFCRTYFEYYRDNQDDTKRYGAISLIKTSALEQVAEACYPILSTRTANLTDAILQGTQYYERQHDPSWVYDLFAYLSKLASPSELSVISNAIDSCVIYRNSTDHLPYSPTRVDVFSGFGCYIPAPSMPFNPAYSLEPWYVQTYVPR